VSGRAAAAGTTASFAGAMLAVLAGSLGVPAPEAASVGPLRRAAPASYAEGAPPGFSGGFGEQSCHACHFHAEVNAGRGRVTLAGVPERFAGGARYPITITLSRPGMQLGGFQLTARFRDDGAQAGTLAPAPGEEQRVRVDLDGQVQYADQRQKGTALAAPETARWSLIWTAPSTAAAVVFHVAANAADADGTVEGDYIHTTMVESAPAALNEVAGIKEGNGTGTGSYKNLNPFAGTAASAAPVCGVTRPASPTQRS
jgi:hypothetical protein